MTTSENSLALHLIQENFGECAKLVAELLIKKHSYPLILIAEELQLEPKKVN
jgi:hypothetical protein